MVRKFITKAPHRELPHRTTVYLPKEIKLTKPTKEINDSLENLKHLSKIMTESTNHKKVFLYLKELSLENLPTKPYQIMINSKHGKVLMELKHKTGLTISSLVTYCFRP